VLPGHKSNNYESTFFVGNNVEAAWSNEGKIFAKIQPSGAIIRIFHDTDLTNLQPPKNWISRIK
jgi:hypothetical protein